MLLIQNQTIRQILDYSTLALKSVTPSPRLESEILLCFVLQKGKEYLYQNPYIQLSAKQVKYFNNLIDQRQQNKPIAYITGNKEFYGINFQIHPQVLIPRPETEMLVEHALDFINQRKNIAILEIGSGSGCISLAILKNLPIEKNLSIVAIDKSKQAILNSQLNSQVLACEDKRIQFKQIDFFKYQPPIKFDLIISNPPYIPTEEISALAKDIIDYEPLLALDGGKDGLDFYRIINQFLIKYLNPDGKCLLEIHSRLETQTREIFGDFTTKIYTDLALLPRVLEITN